jgi:hypothetical protein
VALETSLFHGPSPPSRLVVHDPLFAENREEGCKERGEEADVRSL